MPTSSRNQDHMLNAKKQPLGTAHRRIANLDGTRQTIPKVDHREDMFTKILSSVDPGLRKTSDKYGMKRFSRAEPMARGRGRA